MKRPWRKTPWPYVRKDGTRSYRLGYRDELGGEHTQAFDSVGGATEWTRLYKAAERANCLGTFLHPPPATPVIPDQSLGDVILLWLALDADPVLEEGLAPATFASYTQVAQKHILGRPGQTPKRAPVVPVAYAIGARPASDFSSQEAPRAWHDAMRRAGVGKAVRDRSWKVLSSCLSWASGSEHCPTVTANGCKLAERHQGQKRRSVRRGGTGTGAGRRPAPGRPAAHWALSPLAVERIRFEQLRRQDQRGLLLAERDATVTSMQYGLGCRNQDVWGLRWAGVGPEYVDITEVVSFGALDEGKVAGSERRTHPPSLVFTDLRHWFDLLTRLQGATPSPSDFVIPGDLGGARWGVTDADTGAVHLSGNQARKWGAKFMTPAVVAAAKAAPSGDSIVGATPYSLRRGGISLRLRAEDQQTVADECATSLAMLSRHYSWAIADLRSNGPRPADLEWRAARMAVFGA